MPLFDFKCNDCNKTFEKIIASGSSYENLTCPQCKSNNISKIISPIKISNSCPSAPVGGFS